MKKEYRPPLVITLHGIRTYGKWQKTFSELMCEHSFKVKNFDYGYFSLYKFLSPKNREEKVDEFYRWYTDITNNRNYNIDLENNKKLPSIVAHSFGTLIIGDCLEKYEDIKFDKIILCGSILPKNFIWSKFFYDDRVNYVLNNYSHRDRWSRMANYFIDRTGPSGYSGFDLEESGFFHQEEFPFFLHSDYFKENHILKYWLPVLKIKPHNLTVITGKEITLKDKLKIIFDETTKFDNKVYGRLPNYNGVEVDIDRAIDWTQKCPDVYSFLIKKKKKSPSGYINAFPLIQSTIEKLKNGKINDNQICNSDIQSFNSQRINLYVMSIIADSDLRKNRSGSFNEHLDKLVNSLLMKLYNYAIENKTLVNEILAVGWTALGRKICKSFNMQQIGSDQFGNPIFCLNVSLNFPYHMEKKYPVLIKIKQVYNQIDSNFLKN